MPLMSGVIPLHPRLYHSGKYARQDRYIEDICHGPRGSPARYLQRSLTRRNSYT
jgi:hypothetical protein